MSETAPAAGSGSSVRSATAGAGPAADPPDDLLRTPQQARSRRTLQRILEAGLRLLESGGPDALTVTGITARARASVGSFYARFQGKDDLLRYMGERSLADAIEGWEAARAGIAADAGLRPVADGVVRALGALYLEGAGRALALLHGIEDPRPSRRRRWTGVLARDLHLLTGAPELRAGLAAQILVGTLEDAARRAVRAGRADDSDAALPPVEVLLSELVELLVGYLGGAVSAPAGPPPHPTPDSLRKPAPSFEPDHATASIPGPDPAQPPDSPPKPVTASDAEPDGDSEADFEPESDSGPEPDPGSDSDPEPDPFEVWG